MIHIPKKFYNTLPNVEDWNTNMGIQKDPPKAVWTRRVDKIADAQVLTDMIEDSRDRITENIRLFPLGVNQMVSVNYGSNPYKIMDKGAFRPPLMRQEDLLPLSRQPRATTSAYTNAKKVKSELIGIDRTQYENSRYIETKNRQHNSAPDDRKGRAVLTKPSADFYMFDPNQYIDNFTQRLKPTLHVSTVDTTNMVNQQLRGNHITHEPDASSFINNRTPFSVTTNQSRSGHHDFSQSYHTNSAIKEHLGGSFVDVASLG